jgi:hypothetical protein
MNGKKLAPLSGVLGVALVIASFALGGDSPDQNAGAAEVVSYYTKHNDKLMAAAALLALGAFFLLVFTTTVAGTLRRASGETGGSSAVSFAGGVILAVGITLFAGVTFSLADTVEHLEPGGAQILNVLADDLFMPLTIGNAAFLLGSGIGVIKTKVLPVWLGWVAVVLGVVALTPGGFFAFMLLGLWTLIVSVLLYRRAGAEPATA